MLADTNLRLAPDAWAQSLTRRLGSWWHMMHFGAVVMVFALSPSTYNRHNRASTARHIYTSTWQVLPWFTVLTALLSLVLIRIVLVTALSYGLSQYAQQMVVRVLVLELIPLSAALFVALRAGMGFNAGAIHSALAVHSDPGVNLSIARLRNELVPRVMATAFSVLALSVLSCVVALVLAYVTVHGFTLWGLAGFTRTVGQVFDPVVALGFTLKTVLFSLAVAVVPMAARLEAARHSASVTSVQPGAVRLFLILFLIEAASLVLKYI
jgi:phospholipid/cholesterol/gamma-HCH transport system permease protein